MARRRWGEWASARMLRALVREGARVHAAAGVRTVAPPVFLVQCVPGPKSAVAGAPAFFGPIPRVTTPGKAETVSATYCICFSAKCLKPILLGGGNKPTTMESVTRRPTYVPGTPTLGQYQP